MFSRSLYRTLGTLGALAVLCFSGQAAADLTVLQVAPLTGPYGGIGWHMQVGAQIAFNDANARGGVGGQKLRLVTNNQEAGDFSKQVRALVDKNAPVALFGFVGDDSVRKLLDDKVLDETGLPLIGARAGIAALGNSHLLFLTRASFEFEVSRVLKHLATTGITTVGLVYEDDAYGREVLGHAQKQAAASGMRLLPSSYLAGSAQVDAAVTAMIKSAPQAVVLASQTAGAAAFVQRFRSQGGTAQLATLSFVEGGHMAKIIGKQAAHGVGVLEIAPNTLNESVPLVRDFRAAYKKFGPSDVEPSQAMMEAYVASRVLIEGLRRANGSKSKLAASLASLDRFDLGGLQVSFANNRRNGVEVAELAVIDRNGRVIR